MKQVTVITDVVVQTLHAPTNVNYIDHLIRPYVNCPKDIEVIPLHHFSEKYLNMRLTRQEIESLIEDGYTVSAPNISGECLVFKDMYIAVTPQVENNLGVLFKVYTAKISNLTFERDEIKKAADELGIMLRDKKKQLKEIKSLSWLNRIKFLFKGHKYFE